MIKKTKDSKNETKKIVKKVSTKQPKEKKEPFFVGVKREMKKVRWPLKKEMTKYSIATLSFIVFFALFFAIGDLLIAAFKLLVA